MNKYEKALKVLDGIRDITKREQLRAGRYLFSDSYDEELAKAGAVCQGYKACLWGSAYLAYGVKIDPNDPEDLPGVSGAERTNFLRNRPGLKLAMDVLDECADPRLPKRKRGPAEMRSGWEGDVAWHRVRTFASQAEEYFEKSLRNKPQRTIRKEILALTAQAKREVRKRAKAAGVEISA